MMSVVVDNGSSISAVTIVIPDPVLMVIDKFGLSIDGDMVIDV